MAEFILVSIVLLVWVIFARTVARRDSARRRINTYQPPVIPTPKPTPPRPQAQAPRNQSGIGTTVSRACPFSCKVDLIDDTSNDNPSKSFSVMVRGRITVPAPMHETEVQVLLADVTNGHDAAMPVLCTLKKWQIEDSPAFCYRAHNGKIPQTELLLTDWLCVATIPAEVLNFPRKGRLNLKFVTSLVSSHTQEEIACAAAIFTYHNDTLGYIDVRENAEKAELLSLQLAISVCGVTGTVDDGAAQTVQQWIEHRVRLKSQSQKDDSRRRLQAAFDNAVGLLNTGQKSDHEQICNELLAIATIVEIYDAMDLCLRVVGAGGIAEPAQTAFVSCIAELLEVDEKKFRAMTQKRLPLSIHQEHDLEFILGITADMAPDNRRQRLNCEYQKWNARVNHPDKEIQAQADQMLTLIAEARNRFAQPANA